MNAVLQCLLNTKRLTDYFLNEFKNNDPKKILANQYYEVVSNLCKKENNLKSYSPNSFKETLSKLNPLFAGIAAGDSKDLINFLIERLHQELNVVNNNINNNNNDNKNIDFTNKKLVFDTFGKECALKYNSPISFLFYAILEIKTGCLGCKEVRYNYQIYNFLEFPLEKVNQYLCETDKKRKSVLPNGKNPDIDLYNCFDYNEKTDKLGGENMMYCNKCNKLCQAVYSNKIYTLPFYLIITYYFFTNSKN